MLSAQLFAFDDFLVSDIRIIGLQRVSTGSIFNVIPISVGDNIDQRKSADITRSLFAKASSYRKNKSINVSSNCSNEIDIDSLFIFKNRCEIVLTN